jgi:hypothetical protein
MRRLQANGTTIVYARMRAGPQIMQMGGAEAHHSMLVRPAIELAGCPTDSAYHRHACGRTCKPARGPLLEDAASGAAALIKGLGCGKAHIGDAAPGSLIAQWPAIAHWHAVADVITATRLRDLGLARS